MVAGRETPMPLYFAYGANMDVAAMAGRCPGARALGRARLARHRFIITRDGYASVVRDPRAVVHGVLWDLGLNHVRTLDTFEEVDRGLYVKITQPVIAETGPRRALIYVGASAEIGAPRPGYLEDVLASAEAWGLPAAYLADIGRFRSGPASPSTARAAPAAAVRPIAAAPRSSFGTPRASSAWTWKP
jgi:gamma-glutamylcyclotransferase (GGCT)/AIG2-like uncharacterized protein YtfP